MKFVAIERCSQCPNLGELEAGDYLRCSITKRIVVRTDLAQPDWCPLPDAPGKTQDHEAAADLRALADRIERIRDGAVTDQFPHKACKTPGDCRREGMCLDSWNCSCGGAQ